MIRLLVGLTGGLASGKSTVADLLTAAGCLVVDADRLVAELYQVEGAGARAVAEIVGPEVLDSEGGVDHEKLAVELFENDDIRAAVEAVIHPHVRRRFEEIAAVSDADIVVLEATLLVEAGYGPDFDVVVAVEAESHRRLTRAVERGLSQSDARARMEAQGDGSARRDTADIVVHNDGSLEDLQLAVDALLESFGDRLTAKRRAGTRE
ncbi:MAG: dephospho-CoA kinase [Acidobacteria bacterium]|nr:dephospho-CoA kinase [Acidobacteriota bacterium]